MIEKLEIENYRGIAHGEISGLAPLTILVGPNSSGKSSVLEALFVGGGPHTEPLARIALRRGFIGDATIAALLPTGTATIVVTEGGNPFRLDIEKRGPQNMIGTVAAGQFQVTLLGPKQWGGGGTGSTRAVTFVEVEKADIDPEELDKAVSQADLRGERPLLIKLLEPLLPGIKDLRILRPGDRYNAYVVDDSTSPWPAIVAGDGIKRLLFLAARLAADKSGIVLVEEPETYLHFSALQQIARLFWQTVTAAPAKQIVATTHSLELLDALFGFEGADLTKAALFRLSLRGGKLKAVRVAGEKVRELRAEIGEDLRR